MNEEVFAADDAGSDAGTVLDEIVGPFYAAAAVTRYLKLGAGELTEQVAANQIIAVPLAGGTPVFPAWQFHPDRHVHEPLLTVWQALRQAADPWTAACWMCAPSRDLDGQTAIAYLVRDPVGAEPDPRRLTTVLALAAADCARWRQ
ncbi:hypothetical protein [Gordonia iterans]